MPAGRRAGVWPSSILVPSGGPVRIAGASRLFALAIRAGLRASDLKQMIYAYPSSASDVSYMF